MIQQNEIPKVTILNGAKAKPLHQAGANQNARISDFRAPTPKILYGQRLQEITDLESSIERQGLIKPLTVICAGEKLIVIDGRKRLAALRRMRFKNTLPPSLNAIPYVVCAKTVHATAPKEVNGLSFVGK